MILPNEELLSVVLNIKYSNFGFRKVFLMDDKLRIQYEYESDSFCVCIKVIKVCELSDMVEKWLLKYGIAFNSFAYLQPLSYSNNEKSSLIFKTKTEMIFDVGNQVSKDKTLTLIKKEKKDDN